MSFRTFFNRSGSIVSGRAYVFILTKTHDRRGTRIINWTFRIGLGIYGDSNSESEEEQNEHVQAQNNDSDEELIVRIILDLLDGGSMDRKAYWMWLQETVKRRQQAFKKTEEEIEARLAEEDEREEQRYEEQYNKQQENHTGNTSCKDSGMFRNIIKLSRHYIIKRNSVTSLL